MAKEELLAQIRDRYREPSKKDKSRILDEFIAVSGHHRKHGIRLLGQLGSGEDAPRPVRGRHIYDEAVIVIWEAADRICGKRLRAALPHLVSQWSGMVIGICIPGAYTAADSQRSHPGPVAETHSSHCGQPQQTPAAAVDEQTRAGPHLQ